MAAPEDVVEIIVCWMEECLWSLWRSNYPILGYFDFSCNILCVERPP